MNELKTNCRIQYTKDVKEKGEVFDLITIDGYKDGKWIENNFIFKSDEREKYNKLIELANMVEDMI